MCEILKGAASEIGKLLGRKVFTATEEVIGTDTAKDSVKKGASSPSITIELILKVAAFILLLLFIGLFIWGEFFYTGDLFLYLVNSSEDPASFVFVRNIVFSSAIITLFLFVICLIAYGVLRIEKSRNGKQFTKHVNETSRKMVTFVSTFPQKISEHVEDMLKSHHFKNEWDHPTDSTASHILDELNSVKDSWLRRYDDLCTLIVTYLRDQIRSSSEDSITINLSIKAFFGNEKDKTVITLGRCIDNGEQYFSTQKKKRKSSWQQLLSEAHRISEDYAFTRICEPENEELVFRCSDTTELSELLSKASDHARIEQYRTYSKRKFLSTIVCPIISLVNEHDYYVIGAICLDLNRKYPEWSSFGSYEENILSCAAVSIEPLILESMHEAEIAQKTIEHYISRTKS